MLDCMVSMGMLFMNVKEFFCMKSFGGLFFLNVFFCGGEIEDLGCVVMLKCWLEEVDEGEWMELLIYGVCRLKLLFKV